MANAASPCGVYVWHVLSSSGIKRHSRGPSRIRTGDGGFAIRCLTTWRRGLPLQESIVADHPPGFNRTCNTAYSCGARGKNGIGWTFSGRVRRFKVPQRPYGSLRLAPPPEPVAAAAFLLTVVVAAMAGLLAWFAVLVEGVRAAVSRMLLEV
jgi:hypothetical protein